MKFLNGVKNVIIGDINKILDKVIWWSLIKGSKRFFPNSASFPQSWINHSEIKILLMSDYYISKDKLKKINDILIGKKEVRTPAKRTIKKK